MIAVSQGILQAQKLNTPKVQRVVGYKRRYFDITAQDFSYESDWQIVPESEIRAISKTKEELDAVKLNEFRCGSMTLTLCNTDNTWQEDQDYGNFSSDAVARLGYIAYRSMFKVSVVYLYEDGTQSEEVRLFTGYVSAVTPTPADKTVQISLDASQILLDDVDAENYSTTVTGEVLGTGDGTTTVYYTSNDNVGKIKHLFLDGLLLAQGTDYSLDAISTYGTPAKITFKSAPTTGKVITADYFYWHTNIDIAEAVNDLLTLAGIPTDSTSRDIDAVTFPYRVIKRQDFLHTDGLRYTCTDLPENVSPAWTNYETTGSATASVAGNVLSLTANSTSTAGSKKWSISTSTAACSTVLSFYTSVLLSSTESFGAINYGAGTTTLAQAGIVCDSSGNATLSIKFGGTSLWSLACKLNETHGFCLYHKPGRFTVFIDGVLRVNYSYTAGTTQTPLISFGATLGASTPISTNATFQDINLCGDFGDVASYNLPLIGTKLYPVMDFGDSIKAFCGLSESAALPQDSAITYFTQTSSDGTSWNSLAPVLSGQISSPPLRYGCIEIVRQTSSNGQELPLLAEHSVTYATLTTRLKMVDCTSYTVFDAISELANIASYVFGFDRLGDFFFKSRQTSSTTPDIVLYNTDVTELTSITDGLINVYNKIVCTYGDYETAIEPSSLNLPQPDSEARYGVRQLSVGSSQLLLEQDTDVATGTAYSYFKLFSEPHRQFTLTTKFLPQIEVSDIVLLRCADAPPRINRKWHVGDSSAHIGQADINIWGHEQQSAFDITGTVLSVAHDPVKMTSELILQEL